MRSYTHRGNLKHGRFAETRWPLAVDNEPGRRIVLSSFTVTMIRRRYARGESPTEIARRYKTTSGHVCNIGSGARRGDY